MKTNWCKILILLIVAGLLSNASADDQNNWIGGVGDWNVAGNWSLGYVPDTLAPTVDGRNVGLAGVNSVATVSVNTEFGDPGGGWTDFYGPEFGATLNIDGASLTHYGFAFAPVADAGANSTINVTNGGTLAVGELLLGDNWWFAGHPYVDLNVYDNSTVTARGWCWLGGTMNIYDGVVDMTGSMNFATANGYAAINIEKGQLIIRTRYADARDLAAEAADWYANGYLTAYGGDGTILIDTTTVPDGVVISAGNFLTWASNPTPADESIQAGILQGDNTVDVTLEWWCGADPNGPVNPHILTHYVYRSNGVTADLLPVGSVDQLNAADPNAMFVLNDLQENTEYFWSIEEGLNNGSGVAYAAGDPNNIEGPVWSFTTKAAMPAITDPAHDTADPSATFTVVDENNVASAYQWYKEGDPNPLTDTGAYSGTTTATLTVTNASLAEEGLYYCIASNGPNTDQSESAYLWTQRLMGHWEFEDDLTDSVAATVAGAPTHDGAIGTNTVPGDGLPSFVTGNGPDGSNSIQFFNDGDYVAIDDPNFFNFHRLGFTVSFWYKVNTPILGEGAWRVPLSKLDGGVGGYLFGIDAEYRQWALFFTNPDDDAAYWADGYADTNGDGENDIDLADGQWHMITAVYNPAATTYTIFTDGDENESVVYDLSDNPLPAAPLSIGGRNTEQAIDGFIDDVRIYSKVLTPLEIADLYVTFATDKWVCVEDPENPLAAFDFVPDCVINLADFAEFAGKWLECQRYPDTFCAE